MYWCALIRILFVQQSQTFQSTFLVFIIVVRLHSDAYLRSSTLSHKMGVAKLCGFRLFWPKLCGLGVFLHFRSLMRIRQPDHSSLADLFLALYYTTLLHFFITRIDSNISVVIFLSLSQFHFQYSSSTVFQQSFLI